MLVQNRALKAGIGIYRKQMAKRAQKMLQKRIKQDNLWDWTIKVWVMIYDFCCWIYHHFIKASCQ
jgi:hypothetical protein